MNPTTLNDDDIEEYMVITSSVIRKTDSHAQVFLKKLSWEKKLSSCIRQSTDFKDETNFKTMKTHLCQIMNHGTVPSYRIIYTYRALVHPIMWFYNHNDPLPEPTKFDSGRKIYTDDIFEHDSLGMLELKQKKAGYAGGYIEMEKGLGLCRSTLSNLCARKKLPDGRKIYRARPTYNIVNALKDIIKPDLWYIFPDELIKE